MIGFKWIIEQSLAGSAKPGLYSELEDDLAYLEMQKFNVILTLTEDPLELPLEHSFELIHFPIPDMGIPLPRVAYEVCTDIQKRIEEGQSVLVHCKAGLGRTGTILACILVLQGYEPKASIKKIRTSNSSYLQNGLQENFVQHFYQYRNRMLQEDDI